LICLLISYPEAVILRNRINKFLVRSPIQTQSYRVVEDYQLNQNDNITAAGTTDILMSY